MDNKSNYKVGDTYPPNNEDKDSFTAGIDVFYTLKFCKDRSRVHGNKIEVHDENKEKAESLRDKILFLLQRDEENQKQCRYKLIVDNGSYESDSLICLFLEVVKHRVKHLIQDHDFID